MELKEIQLLVFITTVVVLILAITLIILFLFFQKKKTAYLIEKRETQLRFEEEISKSKMEIREQALQNISWEIHDNVGQLLSVAKMQLNMLHSGLSEKDGQKVFETGEIIGKSLQELRGLAKSLNPDVIKSKGLLDSVTMEIERFNKLNFIKSSLNIVNEPYGLSDEKEIILFRILQEFFNNSLKHSKGSELNVNLEYKTDRLNILAMDNGVGFNIDGQEQFEGIGFKNMTSRAEMIGAKIQFISEKNRGTQLKISCPK